MFYRALIVVVALFVPGCLGPVANQSSGAAIDIAVTHGQASSFFGDGMEFAARFVLLDLGPTEIGIVLPPGTELLEGISSEIVNPRPGAAVVERTYRVLANEPGRYHIAIYASVDRPLDGVTQRQVAFVVEGAADSARVAEHLPKQAALHLTIDPREASSPAIVARVESDTTMRVRAGPVLASEAAVRFVNGSGIWSGTLEAGREQVMSFAVEINESWPHAEAPFPMQIYVMARGDPRFGTPIAEEVTVVDFSD